MVQGLQAACTLVSKEHNITVDIYLYEWHQVANVNVRNPPDAVHRTLRIQAAHHGRNTKADIRDIVLKRAAKPEGR